MGEGEKKKKGREEEKRSQGMETEFMYGTLDFVWVTWNFKALYGEYLISKARVLIKLYPNLGFLKIGLIKPHMVHDNHRILSIRMDSWLIESL